MAQFLDLPLEIRRMIYALLLVDRRAIYVRPRIKEDGNIIG